MDNEQPLNKIKRMRTIPAALKELKSVDPGCSITDYLLRKMCDQGIFKVTRVGHTYLINFDDLLSYLKID